MRPTRSLLLLAALAATGCAPDPAHEERRDARDLTLATAPAGDAVLGAAELVAMRSPPSLPAVRATPAPRPRIARRAAQPAAPDPAPTVDAPAAAEPRPAPQPVVDAWAGAGTALEPGQSVGVVPVAMGTGSQLPPTELVSERGIRWTGMVHGDDRCIPGRDEMLPGFRARRN